MPRSRPKRRRPHRGRRLAAIAAAAVIGAATAAAIAGVGPLGDAVMKITLPLEHEDIIRQQAAEKGLDPAFVAAVIYEESKFTDATSSAGARGLMQITPETADFIAQDSGGTAFTQEDLSDPDINIRYGTYYLRYLSERYDDDEALMAAAYNAGETNVNRWIDEAGGRGEFDTTEDIPFPETESYVADVLEREREYRENYADELGL